MVQPNFLIFITDQQSAEFLGCYGHPVLKTPHIDAIAARGTRFDNFYVANPACQPNRATLMTGRMPSLHKVRSNGIPLSLQAVTFTDLLKAHGYNTALIGKSHLQNMLDLPTIAKQPKPKYPDALPPKDFAEATRPAPDDGPYDQEHPHRWQRNEPLEMTLPYYGYDHVDLCTGHGGKVGGHYYQWLVRQRADVDTLRDPDNQLAHDYACPQAYRLTLPEELHPTNYVAERAMEYLSENGANGAPFCLTVSFPDPHHPFTPPGRYWDLYDPADMDLPPSFSCADDELPPHVQWARRERKEGRSVIGSQSAFAVTEREAREARALTCGMIALIDDAVGRVMGALHGTSAGENTVVVFMSDHGDYLGSHGLLLKGPLHYRALVRTPFIWADTHDRPAKNAATDALCGTLDFGRSILDRASIEPFNGMQGQSILDILDGNSDGADAMLIEDEGQRAYLGYTSPPKIRSLITKGWRLTVAHNADWGELYDLAHDPHEMCNLWDDTEFAAQKSELLFGLVRKQASLSDTSPWPTARA